MQNTSNANNNNSVTRKNIEQVQTNQINKRARLQPIAQQQHHQPQQSQNSQVKRQNSQSSISNQVSNKRSAHYPTYTSNNPPPYYTQSPTLISPQIHSPQTHINYIPQIHPTPINNQVQYPFYYRHSNTPTIVTTSTNNFQPVGNLNNNFTFTPNTQLTPKLHYQLLQSSIKRPINSNYESIEGSVDQNLARYYSNQQITNSQSPESFDNKMNQSYTNMSYNQPKETPHTPQQQQQQPSASQSMPSSSLPDGKQSYSQTASQLPSQSQAQPPAAEQTPPSQQIMSEEEQLLISNLQETYKAILKLEVETQQRCAAVNQKLMDNNTGAELNSELWIVYKHVIQLLDHYYDFLLYALSPTSTRTGKPLVANYRILKRMWVYGIVAFLEVLKNVVAIFVEHEVCACFVSYSFNIISCLTDPELGIDCWWAEKLGDLSRMAIALYPARYMDWKMSSIFWYQEAIKIQYGHGKIYYHMCSVEQDNLEALMLIGKAVNCRDPFVPTQQYLRMIVDNVCSQRNMLTSIEMSMIDFVKIHKVLMLPSYNMNEELINIVSHYSSNFGTDNTNIDFFQIRPDCSTADMNDKVTFWFQKGANFALSNIYTLIGFGSSANPFAKLFDLPNALKERKDKKDRREKRRRSRSNSNNTTTNSITMSVDQNDPEFLNNSTADLLDENYWFKLLNQLNKGSLELSMKMLKQYMSGPVQSSTPHVIVWLYFLISVSESYKIYPTAKPLFVKFFQALFPWKSLVLYLNDILCIVRSVPELRSRYSTYLQKVSSENNERELFCLFQDSETLWEVWKCWGSLWFDRISLKEDYTTVFETGIKNDIFDVPLSGPIYNTYEDGERYIRILLLGGHICKYLPEFGLKMKGNIFKFESSKYSSKDLADPSNLSAFESFINDSRVKQLTKFSGYRETTKELSEQSEDQKNSGESNSTEAKSEKVDSILSSNGTNSESIATNENKTFESKNMPDPIVDTDFELSAWTNKNTSPKLPMWDHNSYGFMTDFINNQYPAVLAKKSVIDNDTVAALRTVAPEDNEYEEDSDEEFEDNDNSDDQYQGNDQYEITSEGGSVNANAPNNNLGSASDLGNDQIHLSSIKPTIIKGDIGDFMDTSITFISLDTNVWLKHCGRIFKCVRSRIFKLAIPLTVFQELRSLRKSNDSLVAESATRAVIIARQLYSENVVLAVRSDGTTASHINETREFEQNMNWRINSDELILQSVKLNDAFGKSLCLGYGYPVGELPNLPFYEELGKPCGFYNGAYRGGYSYSSFPISTGNNFDARSKADRQQPQMNNSWSGNNKKELLALDNQGNRGEKLTSTLLASKTTQLNKNEASEFGYNIIVTDDHNMIVRAETIGLKQMRSSEWFKIVDKVSFGRCYD